MKIRIFSTAGAVGVWIFNVCVTVLYEVSVVWSVWVHSSYYFFDDFNLCCVSDAVLGVLWLFL